MAALTLANLTTLVRDLIGDPINTTAVGGVNNTDYTATQVTDSINWAIQYVCTQMHYTYVETMIISAVGTVPLAFPLSGGVNAAGAAAPINDYLIIRRVMTGGTPHLLTAIPTSTLLLSSEAEEDMKSPTWRGYSSATIPPKRWLLKDGTTIFLVPTPTVGNSTTNFVITVGYTQKPTDLAADADPVDSRIPWPVQNYLKYAAAAWLKQLGGRDVHDQQQAAEWMKMFNDFVGLES